MEVNGEIRALAFKKSLKQGTVFRLKGEEPFASEKYHLFFVLNYDPQTDELLLLVNGTSQVKKVLRNLRFIYHAKAETTAVILEPGSYKFITKQTIINCNEVHQIGLGSLDFRTDCIKPIISDELRPEDIRRIVQATLNSPLVAEDIKRQIRRS